MAAGKTLRAAAGLAAAGAAARSSHGARRRVPPTRPPGTLAGRDDQPGPGDIQPDKLPSPLREYGERTETRIRPAPGDRGTELAVRLKDTHPDAAYSVPARLTGDDPHQDLRRALRHASALLEADEILRPDTPPTTRA